jgi:5-methyltetrahydrofolate--homocysteine methyltransferase
MILMSTLKGEKIMSILERIEDCIVRGNREQIENVINLAINEKVPPAEIVNKSFVQGMEAVAKLWKSGEYFIPDVILSAKVMQKGMETIRPFFAEGTLRPRGTFAIGTVKGDLHDIGKNIVALMAEGAGFRVINLGTDVSPEAFLKCVIENPDVKAIGLSALLTTTMPQMGKTIEVLKQSAAAHSVKVFIGGAPVTQAYAKDIGADFYSADAVHAVEQLNELFK